MGLRYVSPELPDAIVMVIVLDPAINVPDGMLYC